MLKEMFNGISQKFSEHLEKKREEQREFERMQKLSEFEDRIALDKQRRLESLEATRQEALRQAQSKTGIARLRALNRAERLGSNNPDTFFSKVSERTQKNMQRTEENKRRNKMLREEAERMKKERLLQRRLEREERMRQHQIRRQFT